MPKASISASGPDPAAARAIVDCVLAWYSAHSRDLPWRRPDCGPWGVLVSEFMLQQTPVSRVLEPWQRWLERWPTPAALAAEPAGEAIRAWGRLGYPRRALRLHAAAGEIERVHNGVVPDTIEELRALPGVGDYTAAAVASFAFGQAHPVLDTNVRRVLARVFDGVQFPARSPTVSERRLATTVMPDRSAHVWAAASMELGALVCTASSPRCTECPVAPDCAWLANGRPAHQGRPRTGQAYAGTDRQARGALLQILREAQAPVARHQLELAWPDTQQRERALASLISDGLTVDEGEDFRLPG